MREPKITAIILAAGQGKRMKLPVAKQYAYIGDKPTLYYSLKAFEGSSVNEIIVVTGKGLTDYCKDSIIKSYGINKVVDVIEGGKERYNSVYAALCSIKHVDYVLIHDGARPFISVNIIERTIQAVIEYNVCVVGIPVNDTIKIVDEGGNVLSTPERSLLWAAQTPQAFNYNEIRQAYELLYKDEQNKKTVTDDAMVYESYIKKPVKMILGDDMNIKLTTQNDMIIAEAYVSKMEKNNGL